MRCFSISVRRILLIVLNITQDLYKLFNNSAELDFFEPIWTRFDDLESNHSVLHYRRFQ